MIDVQNFFLHSEKGIEEILSHKMSQLAFIKVFEQIYTNSTSYFESDVDIMKFYFEAESTAELVNIIEPLS